MNQRKRTFLQAAKPNHWSAFLSVTLVLFCLGGAVAFLLLTNRAVNSMKEQVDILVELTPNTTDTQRQALESYLDNTLYYREGTLRYVPNTEALEEMKSVVGGELEDMENPFYNMYRFRVASEFMNNDSLVQIRQGLQQLAGVGSVYYQPDLLEQITRNIRRVGLWAIVLTVLLSLLAVTLIHNTIRLSLYANRFLLKNMQLVGADWGFIQAPYIRRAIQLGIGSALLAMAALFGIGFILHRFQVLGELTFIGRATDYLPWVGLVSGLLVLGVAMYVWSTRRVIRKYLHTPMDELY